MYTLLVPQERHLAPMQLVATTPIPRCLFSIAKWQNRQQPGHGFPVAVVRANRRGGQWLSVPAQYFPI